jgi:hypothetical protein
MILCVHYGIERRLSWIHKAVSQSHRLPRITFRKVLIDRYFLLFVAAPPASLI